MRFWHGFGYTALEELTPLSRHAESIGFHGITLGDHWVTAETQQDSYAISEDLSDRRLGEQRLNP